MTNCRAALRKSSLASTSENLFMPLRISLLLLPLVLLCGCDVDTAKQPAASGVSAAPGPPGPPSPNSAAPGPPAAAADPEPTIAYELLQDEPYENAAKGFSIQLPKGLKADHDGDAGEVVHAASDGEGDSAFLSVRFSKLADSPDFNLDDHVRKIEADPSIAGFEKTGIVETGDLAMLTGETKWIYTRRMIGDDKVGALTYYTLVGDRVVLTTAFCHDEHIADLRPAFDASVQTMRLNEPNE
jgi:hypothetical protein